MNNLKKCLPDLAAVVFFILIAFAYFFVPVSQGKILFQHDASAGVGAGAELQHYRELTGKDYRWTNSIFGGMPTYQISPSYKSDSGLTFLMKVYQLGLPDYVCWLFLYLLGFYILLRAFGLKQVLSAAGAVAWAFSSYFLIIIAAGHGWKVQALTFLPPMIAGVVLAYRGKYLWGFIVTALFTAFEIKANHVQMTYYFLYVMLFMVLAFLAQAIKTHRLPQFLKATGVCVMAALLGLALNASSLYHTWQYSQQSMRGKSELTQQARGAQKATSGLDRDYITNWSYGIDETMTLLVPNAKGGASVPLSQSETAMKKANPQVEQMLPGIYDGLTQYFGSQPGTSGPVYVGAFVLFLFILGLFIVKGPMKWALLAATLLSVMLAWGKNFMGLTDFFIDHVPMYAKFRTVASILVIAEFTIPLLAALTLKTIIDQPELLSKKMKFVWISFALTGGVSLILAIAPGFMSPFVTEQERQMLSSIQGMTPDVLNMITGSLTSMREALVTSDALRSLVFIILGLAVLLCYKAKWLKAPYMTGIILALCLVDLWQIDKRYLNDSMFVNKSERENPVQMSDADRQILKDKSLDYRVLNFASNTFNENETSYFHKSLGGYHPAKLMRYQDLIDHYIAPEMQSGMSAIAKAGGNMQAVDGQNAFRVINMLNAKYFILPLQGGKTMAMANPYALGNAWFVNKVTYVGNADAELGALGNTDLRHEAVADKKFEGVLGQSKANDTTAVVKITSYAPDELHYTASSKNGGIVVFSEIYYPEWTATIDGKPAEIGRADYTLRALNVAPGKHDIVLTFHPKSITVTEDIAYAAYAILAFAIILGGVVEYRRRKNQAA